jgi:hypothetical protein
MTAAKKQSKGVPAHPAGERKYNGELTRKARKIINKERLREVNKVMYKAVKDQVAAHTKDLPRKTSVDVAPKVKVRASKFTIQELKADWPYTDELDAQLFQLLSTGSSLDTISKLEGMPPLWIILGWLADATHKLNTTYTRARNMVIPLYEDRALDIALNPKCGTIKVKRQALTKDGKIVDLEETREGDNVERAKLAFGAYQWALGWMVPKKHGKQATQDADKPNEQLEALFQSLKAGPKDTVDD